MKTARLLTMATFFVASVALAEGIVVGEKLPSVTIEDKGQMVFDYDVVDGVMIYEKGSKITHKTFNSDDLTGKIRSIYHLAARGGTEDINQPYIEALTAAKLPQYAPDSPYKTTTILNTDDALWGTATVAVGMFEGSQKKLAHDYYVVDSKGEALDKWGLQPKNSAVILLDRDGTVLYFKEGKMSDADIASVIALIQDHLAM
jgi:YtfJ family uncharacterized protein